MYIIRPKLFTPEYLLFYLQSTKMLEKKNKIKKHTIYLKNIIYHVYIKKMIFIRQN